ncbi:MAG: flagellar basal-body MS-ring/collar protein FliF [Myxococcota bacterium]
MDNIQPADGGADGGNDAEPPRWRAQLNELKARYQALSARTRLLALGGGGALAAALAVYAFVGQQSGMDVLFADLSSDDSGRIIEQLGGLRVPYELQQEGATILVPTEQVHETRLSLAAVGLPSGGDAGFELFDEQRFGESEFSERVKYHRALEGELARTITHLSGVERARVHLVLPSRSLFVARDDSATASVVLHLRAGRRLSEEQAGGIIHLVASSVRGLEPDAVTVVDGEGRSVGGGPDEAESASDALAYRRQVEREKERAAQELLDTTLGSGVAVVRVSADVSFTREERTEERFLPDEVAARSVQIEEERNASAAEGAAEGVPGAASNLPGGAPAGGEQDQRGVTRRSETRNFEVSRTTRRAVEPVGRIERLHVAVVVDGTWTGEGDDRSFTARDDEELARLQDVVAHAVGVTADRGDEITVNCVPFASSAEDPISTEDPIDALLGRHRVWKPYIFGAAMVPFALFGLIWWIRRRRRKAREKEEAIQAEVTDEALPAVTAGEGDDESAKPALTAGIFGEDEENPDGLPSADQLRAELSKEADEEIPLLAAELATEDPARAARVIRGWLMALPAPKEEDNDGSADHAA